ncbi:MAG TPA: SHOCT domain-containing protein [Jiangellales bacterium]|nr:SHOCT domain-containing protein [Jiangellales bacterium]
MPGLIRGVARTAVVAGTATAVSGRVSRRQQGRWAAQEAQQAQAVAPAPQPQYAPPPQPAYAPSPAADSGSDMDAKIAQLKELGQLRDQGILTEQEFGAQKARILGY